MTTGYRLWLGLSGLAGAVVFVVGLFLYALTGDLFMPSMDWGDTMAWPSSVAGMLFAGYTVTFIWRTRHLNPRMEDINSPRKAGFAVVFGFLLMWVSGYCFFFLSSARIHAAIVYEDVSHPYVVKRTDRVDDGFRSLCSSPIDVVPVAFMVDSFCRVPQEVRDALSEGDTLYAVGKGSRAGVFINELRW